MTAPIKEDPTRLDEKYMRRCLELAAEAAADGEVPVGAVIVRGAEIVAEARNRTRAEASPLAHAEMLALGIAFDQARREDSGSPSARGAHPAGRIPDATLYCSLEPCFMCTGALLHARVSRIVFAAADPKFGACGSLACLPEDSRLNHRCPVRGGVLAEASAALLREFFQRLR